MASHCRLWPQPWAHLCCIAVLCSWTLPPCCSAHRTGILTGGRALHVRKLVHRLLADARGGGSCRRSPGCGTPWPRRRPPPASLPGTETRRSAAPRRLRPPLLRPSLPAALQGGRRGLRPAASRAAWTTWEPGPMRPAAAAAAANWQPTAPPIALLPLRRATLSALWLLPRRARRALQAHALQGSRAASLRASLQHLRCTPARCTSALATHLCRRHCCWLQQCSASARPRHHL